MTHPPTITLTTDQLETLLVTAARIALAAADTGYPPECHLHISEGVAEDVDLPHPVIERAPDIVASPQTPTNIIIHV